jgi:cephalosporin-C deacetylase-like acetyl esterase
MAGSPEYDLQTFRQIARQIDFAVFSQLKYFDVAVWAQRVE